MDGVRRQANRKHNDLYHLLKLSATPNASSAPWKRGPSFKLSMGWESKRRRKGVMIKLRFIQACPSLPIFAGLAANRFRGLVKQGVTKTNWLVRLYRPMTGGAYFPHRLFRILARHGTPKYPGHAWCPGYLFMVRQKTDPGHRVKRVHTICLKLLFSWISLPKPLSHFWAACIRPRFGWLHCRDKSIPAFPIF